MPKFSRFDTRPFIRYNILKTHEVKSVNNAANNNLLIL